MSFVSVSIHDPTSLDADVGLDGEAGTKLVVRVLVGKVGEVDPDGKTLDDFDVVAGGILRREEREHGSGRSADLRHLA